MGISLMHWHNCINSSFPDYELVSEKTTAQKHMKACKKLLIGDEQTGALFAAFAHDASVDHIKTRSAFEGLLQQTRKEYYETVLILVELEWEDVSVAELYGYTVLKHLLDSHKLQGSVRLLFVSTLSRKALANLATNRLREFSCIFPHCWLGSATADLPPWPPAAPPLISEAKLRYLREYCFTELGFLDAIIHDVRNCDLLLAQEPCDTSRVLSSVKSILKRLNNNTAIFSESREIRGQIQQLGSIVESPLHPPSIRNALAGLDQQLRNFAKEIQQGPVLPSKAHGVIIVEDQTPARELLENFFKQYFKVVIGFATGTAAKRKLEELAGNSDQEFKLLVTDLVLTNEDGFWDEVQGYDLLEFCNEKLPYLVRRVFTEMPSNAYPKVVRREEMVLRKQHLNVLPAVDLKQFVKTIFREIEQADSVKNQPGPTHGKFADGKHGKGLKFYLNHLKETKPETFRQIEEKASALASKFCREEFSTAEATAKLNSHFPSVNAAQTAFTQQDVLVTILAHRLIVLHQCWAAKEGQKGWLTYQEVRDEELTGFRFHPGFRNPLRKVYKNYFYDALGFGISDSELKPLPDDCPDELRQQTKYKLVKVRIDVEAKQLFAHEAGWWDWLNNGGFEKLSKARTLEGFSSETAEALEVAFTRLREQMAAGKTHETIAGPILRQWVKGYNKHAFTLGDLCLLIEQLGAYPPGNRYEQEFFKQVRNSLDTVPNVLPEFLNRLYKRMKQ